MPQSDTQYPFILSFTLCASFSISSAFLTTSTESIFSFVLSTYSFSSVDQLDQLFRVALEVGLACLVGLLRHFSFHPESRLVCRIGFLLHRGNLRIGQVILR